MAYAKYKNGNILEIRAAQKVGSTTIHSILRESLKLDHNTQYIKQYYTKRPKNYSSVPTHRIAVIRDPVDRLKSVYSDRVIKKNKNECRSVIKDWNDFIVNLEQYRQNFPDIRQHCRPQIIYIDNIDQYNKVFNISEISTKLLDYIYEIGNVRLDPIHKKSSNSEKRNIVVTDQHKKLIRKYYKEDYTLLKDYF